MKRTNLKTLAIENDYQIILEWLIFVVSGILSRQELHKHHRMLQFISNFFAHYGLRLTRANQGSFYQVEHFVIFKEGFIILISILCP